jgi:hypothetical protein
VDIPCISILDFMVPGVFCNLGDFMHSAMNQEKFDWNLTRWNTLPLAERKRQFRELVRSPYWHFLPEEIKDRLHKLVSTRK